GDEVAGAGGDVVERKVDAEGFHRHDPGPCLAVDGDAVEAALPGGGRVDGEEEPHRRPHPPGKADVGAALQLVLVPPETKLVETPANDTCLPGFELEPDGIGVAPGRVEDAGEEAPVLTHRQGPALVGLDGVSLGSLPSAKARSQIRPDAFLGF